MRKAQDTAPATAQAENAKESKYGKTKAGVGAQRAVRSGTGCTLPEACLVQASNHQGSGKRRWTVTTRVAKTPERGAGQIHRCDNPIGDRAQGFERSVDSISLLVFSFRLGPNHSL